MQDNFFTSFLIDRSSGKSISVAAIVDGINNAGGPFLKTEDLTAQTVASTVEFLSSASSSQFKVLSDVDSNGVVLEAPTGMTSSYNLKFPADIGIDGQILKLNSSLDFIWASDSGQTGTITLVTNNYTVSVSDDQVIMDAINDTIEIELPLLSAALKKVDIKCLDGGINFKVVANAGDSGALIDGLTEVPLTSSQSLSFIPTNILGNEWVII